MPHLRVQVPNRFRDLVPTMLSMPHAQIALPFSRVIWTLLKNYL